MCTPASVAEELRCKLGLHTEQQHLEQLPPRGGAADSISMAAAAIAEETALDWRQHSRAPLQTARPHPAPTLSGQPATGPAAGRWRLRACWRCKRSAHVRRRQARCTEGLGGRGWAGFGGAPPQRARHAGGASACGCRLLWSTHAGHPTLIAQHIVLLIQGDNLALPAPQHGCKWMNGGELHHASASGSRPHCTDLHAGTAPHRI